MLKKEKGWSKCGWDGNQWSYHKCNFFVQVIVFEEKKKSFVIKHKKESTNILQKSINYAHEQSIVVVVEVIDDVVITNNDLACYTSKVR
jgi:hypothetical protein